MKKTGKNSSQTNQPDYTLGIPDYICLIKILAFRLAVPFDIALTRNDTNNSRNYNDIVTYLRDGLTQSIKNKIGEAAAKQLFKDLEAICKINSELSKHPESLERHKQKLSKLIGVGEADLERFSAFELDRLTPEQRTNFEENGFTTLLNFIQGAIHFDPKKSVTQSYEVSIGNLPVSVNPIQMVTCFCCKELSVKFYKKMHLACQTVKLRLLDITFQNGTYQSTNQEKPEEPLKKLTAPLSLLYFQSNSYFDFLLEALKDIPHLIFGAFDDSFNLKYIAKHPEKVRNAIDYSGMTLLHLACELGRLNICTALIKIGVDLTAKSDDGATALFVAAYRGHFEIVHALLTAARQQNVNLDAIRIWANTKKKTFLDTQVSHLMAQIGNHTMAKLIIDESAFDSNLYLQLALAHSTEEIILDLLKGDMAPDEASVIEAFRSCSLEIIKIVLSKYRANNPTPLNTLLLIMCNIEFKHGHTLMTEKIIALFPEYSSGKFARELIYLALSFQSPAVLQRLLELGVNWRPNDDVGESLLYLAMETSRKNFALLFQYGAYFSDPLAALQQAIQMNKPKFCQIILEQKINWNFDDENFAHLLYQLLENYPQDTQLHNAILNLKPFYSLTTILLMDLPDSTIIKFIDHADQIAIKKPHKQDNDQVLTLQEYVDSHTPSEKVVTQLLSNNIIKAPPAASNPQESAIRTSYHDKLSALNIPNADMMQLLPKMLSDHYATTLLNEYLKERTALLEKLKIAQPTKNFQNHALSGLRSNVAKALQSTPSRIEPSPRLELSLFRTHPTKWIYLDSIHFTDIEKQFKLAKSKLGFNHYVMSSNLDSCIKNFDATNDLSEFKSLTTSDGFLAGVAVKMILAKAFKVTVNINGKIHTLDAPAELKVKSSDARLLLAELSCGQPGSATIYIPVFYLPKGLHDNRYKEGTVFSGGSINIERTNALKPYL